MLCRMFRTSVNVDPRPDQSLFGNEKERTASLTFLKKALKEFGIDTNHYLDSEIDDFIRRRDWLAHRMFIDPKSSKEETRAFQKRSLEELIINFNRLLSVFLAISKKVVENSGEIDPLPDGHIILKLCQPYEREASTLLASMMTRKPLPNSDGV